jgi:hypothetical protein
MGIFRKSIKAEDYFFDISWPYTPKQQVDYAEESFTFKQIYLQYVQLMAQGWFGTEERSLAQVFENSSDVDLAAITPQRPEGEISLFDEIGVQTQLLGTSKVFEESNRISWSDSDIAKSWQNKLTQLGVNLFAVPSPQNPSIDIVTGPWTLFDNETPLPIFGEAWKNKRTGEEFIYWFFDALVKTRYSSPTKEVHPTHAFYMPAMFQRIGYVSETLFPSSMVRLRDRLGEFGLTDAQDLPSLAFHTVKDYLVTTLISENNQISQRIDWSPETTRYGYLIDSKVPFLSENDIIPKIVDALPKAASILMDGFCNWTDGGDISFQDELFLDVDLKGAQLEPFELGLFVAGTAYGRLVWKSLYIYSLVRELRNNNQLLEKDKNANEILSSGFWSLIHRSCGSVPLHSVNSFFYNLTEKHSDQVSKYNENDKTLIRRILGYYSQYPIDDQNANALSNLARFEFLWGDLEKSLGSAGKAIQALSEKSKHYHDELWNFSELNRLPIKFEAQITQARCYVLLGKTPEAKNLLNQIVVESVAAKFEGSELSEAKQLLASL